MTENNCLHDSDLSSKKCCTTWRCPATPVLPRNDHINSEPCCSSTTDQGRKIYSCTLQNASPRQSTSVIRSTVESPVCETVSAPSIPVSGNCTKGTSSCGDDRGGQWMNGVLLTGFPRLMMCVASHHLPARMVCGSIFLFSP